MSVVERIDRGELHIHFSDMDYQPIQYYADETAELLRLAKLGQAAEKAKDVIICNQGVFSEQSIMCAGSKTTSYPEPQCKAYDFCRLREVR